MKPPFFMSYFITDPIEYGDTSLQLEHNITYSLNKHCIDMICFRDKLSKDIETLAMSVLSISKKLNISKVIINKNINLAVKLGFDGVHLTSEQFDKINIAKKYNLYIIISCHTEAEVILAKEYGVDAITYSPIFYKENKGQPKGIENLKDIVFKYQSDDFRIIALGGIIDDTSVYEVKNTGVSGFASIRYFK